MYDFSHGVDDGSEHDSIIVAFHAMEKSEKCRLVGRERPDDEMTCESLAIVL